MTAADALALLRGPRREEVQGILDEFFDGWGHVLSYHPRVVQFGCFFLWLEQRGARQPGRPDNGNGKVAVGDRKDKEKEDSDA